MLYFINNVSTCLFPCQETHHYGTLTHQTAMFQIYQHARSCRRVTIKPKHVIKPFLVLLSLNVTILTLWTVIAPWKCQRVDAGGVDEFDRPTATYGTCASDQVTLAKVLAAF
jgi:hypothetical protein